MGHRPYLRVVEQVEHSPLEHGRGGLHASPKDVPHRHEEVVVCQLQPRCRRAVVLGAEPHLQEGIHEVPHAVPTEGFLPGDTGEPPTSAPAPRSPLSQPLRHLVFGELLLEQLVPDLEALLQQGQVLVGEDLGEKSPVTAKGSSSAQR